MKSFNSLVQTAQTITNDSSGSAQALFKTFINQSCKNILGSMDLTWTRATKKISSGTSIQWYDPPYNIDRIENVLTEYGGTWQFPKEVRTETEWQKLNNVNIESTVATHWYWNEKTKKVGLFPIPSTSDGTIKYLYSKKIRDFSVADYSTGSATVASDGTIVTGSNTVWHAGMVGRYLKFRESSTAIDDYWFEIDSFGSTTSIGIKEAAPNAVSGGTYTISEMMPLPNGFEDLPLWYSLSQYYQTKEKPSIAANYEAQYREGVRDLKARDGKTIPGLLRKREAGDGVIDVNTESWAIEIEE